MGTFEGHFLPGISMTIWALWWTTVITRKLTIDRRQFRNRACYLWSGRNSINLEAWGKVSLCALGIFGEIWTGFSNGKFIYIGHFQHITMYLFFLLSGVIDFLCTSDTRSEPEERPSPVGTCQLVPAGSDYASLIIAASIEWLLFRFHLHGRSSLDVLMHTLLGYTLVVAVAILCAECVYPTAVIFAYLRCIAVLAHGLWFITIGYVLHTPWGLDHPGPFRDPESASGHMIATCMFACHYLTAMLICAGLAVWVRRATFYRKRSQVKYMECPNDEEATLGPWNADQC